MTVGVTYGPEWNGGVQPWVEFGAGYYREETTHPFTIDVWEPYLPTTDPSYTTSESMVGGYFGAGVDVPLSGRLTMGTGVRIHGWSDYSLEGLLAIQSGLSFGF